VGESEERDGAAVRFPPPLVPVIALAAGVLIQHFVWALPAPLSGVAKYTVGVLLLAVGLAFMTAAFQQFQRTGQDPKPWKSSPEIIAAGIYKWTRNPMYVSMGLLQGGIGVLISNTWVVVLIPISGIVIYLVAIRHEEAYLERKFGASYTSYKSTVRRWL
jgi:protein-S-isoprenylcysteine O-methyltransferase Ste14